MMYNIDEIFDSVQAEGCHVGWPARFVRLWGCNVNCNFCDTPQSDKGDARQLTFSELLEAILHKLKTRLVIFTGGEPTLQELGGFVKVIHERGHQVAVETNGTQPDVLRDLKQKKAWITWSPKPLTAEQGWPAWSQLYLKLFNERLVDEIKILWGTLPEDLLAACIAYSQVTGCFLSFQPLITKAKTSLADSMQEQIEEIKTYLLQHPKVPARISVQWHKLVGIR